MGLRTILIAAGIALASTLGLAQRTSSPPASTTTTTGATTTGAATTGVNSVNPAAIPAAGESNVPIGINAVGAGSGTNPTAVPTAIIVPANSTGFVGPSQSNPLVSTPSITFVNSADGTTTVPVVNYGGGAGLPNSSSATASAANASTGSAQTADLNLGSVNSISDLYGDNRSVAEVSRMYKARKNGVQNARVYTNADIDRIRQQAGEGSTATSPSAMPAGSMPASDQAAEQNNQGTTPQVPAPPANQKPSPFTPKK